MPSGSKKRKAAKKKKEAELHAQTPSIASPEESGNEHKDDVYRAQTHGQAGEEGEKDRAFGVESGSPICRTNALNQEAVAEERTGEISVDQDYPVESLEVTVDGPHGGRDESKQGVESDKNVSIQKVGSQELSGSVQYVGDQRVSDQKTTNGSVELPPTEAEYESESKKSSLTTYQEGRSGADTLKLESGLMPVGGAHTDAVECQEGQGVYAIGDSVVQSGLDGEASIGLKDTQGFKEGPVTSHQELSSDAGSVKLELPVMNASVVHAESVEFQEQGGQGIDASLVHSRLGAGASSHCQDTQGFRKDSVAPHQKLSGDADLLELESAEFQQEQGGHAIDHSLVLLRFMNTGDVVKDSVMPHRELSICADSLESKPDSTPVSVVHTEIVEFEQDQGGHGIDASLVHSSLDGEASTHSEDTGDVGKDSVKPHRELSSDADLLKVESDVTPIHTEVVEFQQEQGGHGLDDSLVLSRLDGEASTNFEDTEGCVKDSVMLHQELSVVVDSSKKLESAALPVYPDAFEIPQEQGQDVDHSLVHLSLGDEAGNQFKYMEDFAKEVSIPASGEKDSDAHGDGVLPGNKLSDISNKVEDTHITSSVSLVPMERDSVVTEGDSSLESKVVCVSLSRDKPTVAMVEPVISSSKEVIRNDSDTSQAVGGDTQTSLNERDMDVELHHQNTANQAVAVRRGFLASWKSCCGFLEFFRGSRS